MRRVQNHMPAIGACLRGPAQTAIRIGCGKQDSYGGAAPQFALHFDVTAALLFDDVDDRQA